MQYSVHQFKIFFSEEIARNVRHTLALQRSFENQLSSVTSDEENETNSLMPMQSQAAHVEQNSPPIDMNPGQSNSVQMNSNSEHESDSDSDQDPEIPDGTQGKVFEDTELRISYSRVAIKRLDRFSLTDFAFSLMIELKKQGQSLLLLSALNGILLGLTAIFENLSKHFQKNLNRNAYITLLHDNLDSAIQIGPCNLSENKPNEIAQRCMEKIEQVLDSHANLNVNKTLQIKVCVLGEFQHYLKFEIFCCIYFQSYFRKISHVRNSEEKE